MSNPLKNAAARGVNCAHRAILNLSGGRIFATAFGMPVVELITTGRKSGASRTTMLTAPIHDDDRVVLVASYGGDDKHPAWFLNLRANPEVEIVIGGTRRAMTARVATADEKAELWPDAVAAYAGYGQYQSLTAREIPLVILEPRAR
jgi:deazaflavin-dependent oxidoreductase (nitroreductase family)